MEIAVATQQLTKVFDPPSGWRRPATGRPVTAVSQVTLTVPAGELFGLLGPNGAGKTTLVKMLCGLILPSGGAATVAGHSLAQSGAIRAAVGLAVADERSFYWRLSARRNLDFFAAMAGLRGRAAAERVNTVLAEVDLLGEADQRFSHFSSGMRQRLSIARSLLHQPQLLFLDEPSRSLDPIATRRLHDLIRGLAARQGMTIFLVTHNLAEAEKLCDRVAFMHRGRLQAVGRPVDLRRQLRPQRHYTMAVASPAARALGDLRPLAPGLQCEPGQGYSRLHFHASEEDGALTAVIDCLRQHQLTIYSIESTPPTLEEVFAYFTREEGRRTKAEGRRTKAEGRREKGEGGRGRGEDEG
jgi:ABC-2 type transport system ATP-binding protein